MLEMLLSMDPCHPFVLAIFALFYENFPFDIFHMFILSLYGKSWLWNVKIDLTEEHIIIFKEQT